MTLKKIHRFILAFLMFLPIFIFLGYIILQFRSNDGSITMSSLFSDFSAFINSVFIFNGNTIILNTFREFILFLGQLFTYRQLLSISDLFNYNPILFVVLVLLYYEIVVLTYDLIFNVFRWFILFIQKLMNKGLEKI